MNSPNTLDLESRKAALLAKMAQMGAVITPQEAAQDSHLGDIVRLGTACEARLDAAAQSQRGFRVGDTLQRIDGKLLKLVGYTVPEGTTTAFLLVANIRKDGSVGRSREVYGMRAQLQRVPC